MTTRTATTTPTRSSGARARPTRDAIAILKADHREVEKLFKAFEKAGDTAYKTKRKLVDQMIAALSQHAAIEEEVLYPAARQEVSDSEGDVLESLEEHHIVKWQLQELTGLAPTDERFNAKVTVLTENVRHHVGEEESELFPLLRSRLGRKRLLELGAALQSARRSAPRRPHPHLPDTAPDNVIPTAVVGVIDRARDLVHQARNG
jgi:hemerythrin-like domain-containing protein